LKTPAGGSQTKVDGAITEQLRAAGRNQQFRQTLMERWRARGLNEKVVTAGPARSTKNAGIAMRRACGDDVFWGA
jgi:hypothetical protein